MLQARLIWIRRLTDCVMDSNSSKKVESERGGKM